MTRPESYALDLLAEALANQSGRLFIDLRDKKSLAYALTASNSSGLDAGSFAFYVASAPEKEEQVRTELSEQLRRILAEPLSPAEFNGARARLLAQWIIDRQTMSARASDLALYDRLGLGADYPQRYTERLKWLTPEAVLQAAQARLDPERPVWIRVGPEK
jgi:zinc protease